MRFRHALLCLLALALCPGPARAVDGVLEINQTCAVQTGCFPGDTAGFPVTITSATPGTSFRLTGDLVVPDTNPGGIFIDDVDDVSIDLNQFSIIRAACLASPSVACMPTSGSTDGIRANPPDQHTATSVRNGRVVGMSQYGLALGADSEVINVRVRWNRGSGIAAGLGSSILDSAALENGNDGIFAFDAVIRGNTSRANGGDGIISLGSVVKGNVAAGNAGDGIRVVGGDLVEDNSARSNGGHGLNLASDCGYRGNVVQGNTTGTVTGGVDLGGNLCDGGACP